MNKMRALGLIVSALVLAITSYMMMHRPLWGFIPLFNYGSIFAIVLQLSFKAIAKDSMHLRWLKLSLFSGVLLTIGFPPSPIFVGMIVGFIPLMMVEKEMIGHFKKAKTGLLFKYLFFGFWLWNLLTTFWVANTAYFAGMVANVANALLMTLPWLVYHRLTHNKSGIWKYFLLAGCWILFEYVHSFWDISWPWLTLGNSMATAYPLIQWYEYTGYFGGSLWIWILNIVIFTAIFAIPSDKRKWVGISAAVLIIPCLISILMYFGYKEKGEAVDVTIIQPNYEPHYKKFDIPEEVQIEKIMALSQSNIDDKTDLIIYPETVFDPVNLDDPYGTNPAIQKLHSLFGQAPNAHILAGIGGYHTFRERPDRSTVRASGEMYYELYNAALMLEKDSSKIQEYHKSKFVPGAELFPFKHVLPFLKPLVKKLGGTYEGFAPQDAPSNFTFGNKSIAPIICYESIYGGWVSGYVDKGAGLLAIVTNDGWWDNTPGHLQHLAIGRLRAIENRKDIVRSANTGTSCFINQRGDTRMETDYEVDAVIRDKVYYNESKTLYSRWGDYIVYLVGLMTLGLIIFSFMQGSRKL